jgi:hypothetical protein
MSNRKSRGIAAAGSVAAGTVTGALTNILTGQWNWAIASGLIGTIALWAAIEAWRASSDVETASMNLSVVQRAGRVAGQIIGVRRRNPSPHQPVSVDQTVTKVAEGGSVIGYDSTTDTD